MNAIGCETIRVTGTVQGVGFRPFVFRLAVELGLGGTVRNDGTGVQIELVGSDERRQRFIDRLLPDSPPLARIDTIDRAPHDAGGTPHLGGFQIVGSSTGRAAATVPPDTAVCEQCLSEMSDSNDRRYGHPFITCTNCGPRFTILTGLPYDRHRTTMASFAMCAACRSEYLDPTSRRFHAQPIGCHDCGPTLTWNQRPAPATTSPPDPVPPEPAPSPSEIIAGAARCIDDGNIVALKGLGGYHLVADATNAGAVQRIRDRKHRPDKPFAVMARDLSAARRIAEIDDRTADLLTSPARPIVLVPRKGGVLADGIAPANPLVGVLLPYTPVHHLLFAALDTDVVVMTSANRSGEPLLYSDDAETLTVLGGLAEVIVGHNREIRFPCDDSVTRLVEDRMLPVRVGRGYSPIVLPSPHEAEGIVAAGGELKNTTAIATNGQIWVSPHLGDMGNLSTMQAFEKMVALMTTLTGTAPSTVTHDRHPRYLTTRWARAQHDVRDVIAVQHHVAHLASLRAEHGIADGVGLMGLVFDGTGYGDDGTIWGGELLWSDGERTERVGHLRLINLPGGDAAITEPWRAALAHLTAAGIDWDERLAPVAETDSQDRRRFGHQLETGFGTTLTSSMGRLFDAVASLLGLHHHITYEAQAAIALEHLAASADPRTVRTYQLAAARAALPATQADPLLVLDPAPMLRAIVDDLISGVDRAAIAAGFHRSLAVAAVDAATALAARRATTTLGLTGGVFANALFVRECLRATPRDWDALTHHVVPPNDGGLSLGQAAIAVRSSRDNHRHESVDARLGTGPLCA